MLQHRAREGRAIEEFRALLDALFHAGHDNIEARDLLLCCAVLRCEAPCCAAHNLFASPCRTGSEQCLGLLSKRYAALAAMPIRRVQQCLHVRQRRCLGNCWVARGGNWHVLAIACIDRLPATLLRRLAP